MFVSSAWNKLSSHSECETSDSIAGVENRSDVIHVNRHNAPALILLVEYIVATTKNTPTILRPAILAGLRSSISEMVSNLFSDTLSADSRAELASRVNRYQIMHNARDYMHDKAGDDISIAHLCCNLGIGRRTLSVFLRIAWGNHQSLIRTRCDLTKFERRYARRKILTSRLVILQISMGPAPLPI